MCLFAENTCSQENTSVLNLKTERAANLPSLLLKKIFFSFQPKIIGFQVIDENIPKTVCQKQIIQ